MARTCRDPAENLCDDDGDCKHAYCVTPRSRSTGICYAGGKGDPCADDGDCAYGYRCGAAKGGVSVCERDPDSVVF